MKTSKYVGAYLLVLVFGITACGNRVVAQEPQLSPPAIDLQITKDNCPSVEVQVDMQISWTNADSVDHILLIERTNAEGVIVEAGGIDPLQPGTTFSITLMDAGQYTYYCTEDRTQFGTITVLSGK